MKKVEITFSFLCCTSMSVDETPTKLPVIKLVRTFTGLGLREAKDLVDSYWAPEGAWTRQVKIILSMVQLGALTAALHRDNLFGIFSLDDVKVLPEAETILDVSMRGVLI